MRWVWVTVLSLLIGTAASSAAQASCQPIHLIQHCPVGGETFRVASGCGHRNFSLINDKTVEIGWGGFDRHQCGKNNFPVYRSFTLEEHSRLEDLVASDDYQSRKEDGYGALAVWLEQQLTGRADPEWHGEMLLWDGMATLFYGGGSRPPTEAHKPVMKRALPLLIEAAESSVETGPARARDHARIAWLLHHTGQRAAALDWMARAERTIGPPPSADEPGPTQTDFTDATIHLDTLALCLDGPKNFRAELCEAGGIASLLNEIRYCLLLGEESCFLWPSWTGDVEETIAKIRSARENDPRFEIRFDDGLRRRALRDDDRYRPFDWWAECAFPEALGTPCTNEATSRWQTKILDHFPNLQGVINSDLRVKRLKLIASELVRCEFSPKGSHNCDWFPGNQNPRDAAERLKQAPSEFAEMYEEQRVESFNRRATLRGQCLASNKYRERLKDCDRFGITDGIRSPVLDSAKVDAAFRKALIGGAFAQLPGLAKCRVAERIKAPEPCYRYRPLHSLDETETLLRDDLRDFDALYAIAEAEAVAKRASLIGSRLAQRQFWRVWDNSPPEIPDYDVRYLNSVNRLIALYPEAAVLIKEAKAETTKRLKTPR